jgi:hypothetical protein
MSTTLNRKRTLRRSGGCLLRILETWRRDHVGNVTGVPHGESTARQQWGGGEWTGTQRNRWREQGNERAIWKKSSTEAEELRVVILAYAKQGGMP